MKEGDPSGRHCLASDDCCAAITEVNRNCYRAQSFATARELAAGLRLTDGGWTVSFSRGSAARRGSAYTDVVLDELAARWSSASPSSARRSSPIARDARGDRSRARAQFKAAGGEDLILVPSLNATPAWADAVAAIAQRG